MSITIVALSGVRLPSKLSFGGSPSTDTPPGNAMIIGAAGEKPSARFQPVGSVAVASMFTGSVVSGIARWRPVGVDGSSTSNADDGHGTMQWPRPIGLHAASTSRWLDELPPHAATNADTTTMNLILIIAANLHRPTTRATGFRTTSRYISRVRLVLIAAIIGSVACGAPPEPKHVNPVTHANAGSASRPNPVTPVGVATPPDVAARDVPCPAPSCAYHAATAAYFTCLAGGAGACFHFGSRCTPTDACMYDATDRTYKQCTNASEGTCRTWAAACEPTSKCMFDPIDGLHHHCDDAGGGACKHWGALCAP